ncbi:FeoB-associated Cys-rich membrane protein [Syntrophus gentianae]|uniref:FeoB-associated Cys-rich membrane protein n=1 Tax=Syntrophus gentianae TaxID=43775 RepID=UPI003B280C67
MILVTGLIAVAAVWIGISFYKNVTGRNDGCGCTGGCQGCACKPFAEPHSKQDGGK